MAICRTCGKRFERTWGQMFSDPAAFHTCLDCWRSMRQIRQEEKLREQGRIEAQQEARQAVARERKMKQWAKSVSENFYGQFSNPKKKRRNPFF